jgi:hypothetical protein
MIRANAARTASARVGGFFRSAGAFVSRCVFAFASSSSPPAQGIVGSICVGAVAVRSMGCIPIGPVLSEGGCFLGMVVNAQPALPFEAATEIAGSIDTPRLGG